MGDYLTPGTTFANGGEINGPNLNAHVADAIFKPTAISARDLKDPAALTDEFLINDAGTLKKVAGTQLYELFVLPGSTIQTVTAEYVANTNLTAIIPLDDTIPQNTEGTEIISVNITPRFADSQILVWFSGYFSLSIVGTASAAVFRDAVASALGATAHTVPAINYRCPMALGFPDSPLSVSALTYKVRVGPASAATMRMNGSTAARDFGGAARSTLILQEIKV